LIAALHCTSSQQSLDRARRSLPSRHDTKAQGAPLCANDLSRMRLVEHGAPLCANDLLLAENFVGHMLSGGPRPQDISVTAIDL
jgi:hypothetical protein